MQKNESYKFAIFPSPTRAKRAKRVLADVPETEVELITRPEQFGRAKVPLRLTMARGGAILGAVVLAAMGALTAVSLELLGFTPQEHLLAPQATLAIIVLLTACLGGLAGGLAFSTELGPKLTRLRAKVRRFQFIDEDRRPVVALLDSDRDLDEVLQRHGVLQTGALG